MPELPEVEIVTRNLNEIIKPPQKIFGWQFFRKNLRYPLPIKDLNLLVGEKILKIHRRAKYILIEFDKVVLISHLGMTGSWRPEKLNWIKRKHDHVAFEFSKNNFLVYEDPRRFGFLEVCDKSHFESRFENLGIEPLDSDLTANYLKNLFHKKQIPIKSALMDQKYIVGIGNIYASEILFRCQISPLKPSNSLNIKQLENIIQWSQSILNQAINSGGSSIDSYRNAFSEKGEFQTKHQVYGRENEKCIKCKKGLIQSQFISGRNSFWCPVCQK